MNNILNSFSSKMKYTLLTIVYLLTLLTGQLGAIPKYRVVDLGDLGSGFSEACAINNKNQIVGFSLDADSVIHAFLWEDGIIRDIGVIYNRQTSAEHLMDINDSSQVFFNIDYFAKSQITKWENNTSSIIDIPLDMPGYIVHAANNSGEIVGEWAVGMLGGVPAFYYDKDTAIDLRDIVLANKVYARGINNLSVVVGAYGKYACWWNCASENIEKKEFGTLGGTSSCAIDINDKGEVVGYSLLDTTISKGFHAFYTFIDKNTPILQDLGALPGDTTSIAYAINIHCQIIGGSNVQRPYYFASPYNLKSKNAVLWEANTIYNLSDSVIDNPGWQLMTANDINDSGFIVGDGIINGQEHAFLLQPVNSSPIINNCLEDNTIGGNLLSIKKSKNFISITFQKSNLCYDLIFYNIKGKQIIKKSNQSAKIMRINTDTLHPGVYILKINAKKQSHLYKLTLI